MCTSPRFIYTNARYLSGVSRYILRVPCGKCEECKQNIRTQYLIRSYYEALRVQHFHGVGIFDTLTYNDNNVPSVYGIKCFRYSDLVNFRKRLKINLSREGYDSTCISYFIASEYGDHTARPHYHILLFAWFPGASAHLLHEHVNKAWSFGFTDKRVKQVCVQNSGLGALSYVSKYVAKSIGDSDALDVAIKQGIKSLNDNQVKEIFEIHKENFKIKHFQSRGYGEYLLDLIEQGAKIHDVDIAKEFYDNGRVMLPDKKNYYKFYPLGHYYIYKTFFDRKYNEVSGKKDLYVLNDIGKSWKSKQYIVSRDKMIAKFEDYRPQLITNINHAMFLDDKEFSSCQLRRLSSLLSSDSFDVKGFCEYFLFYRNLSWLDSQYCPFELYSFQKDVIDDLNKHCYIENRCYDKNFIDENGAVVTKPYSKAFRDRLVSRRYDVLSCFVPDEDFATLIPFYLEVVGNDIDKRNDKLVTQSLAREKLRRHVLQTEVII